MADSTDPDKPTGGRTRKYDAKKADRGSRCGARGCDGPVFVAKPNGLEHPAIKWLATCIDRAVLDYSRISNIDYSFEWHVQAWPNINVKGDYHNLHNHPHSWLSGTYYVNVPDQSAVKMHRTDLNPAEISFFDPRPQANMNAVKGDGQCDPEFRTLPKNGDLLLWPSFLHHLVHPNLVDDPRISISFNVIFKNPTSHF